MTSIKATCWSITINNPTETDVLCAVQGWVLTGQYEIGAEGTRHFQGMLKTPQVRFSAVKKQFPRAHIEVARAPKALEKYVHKEDTRVGYKSEQLNVFTAQQLIASKWREEDFIQVTEEYPMDTDVVMIYLDRLTAVEIAKGAQCLEFIAINPMWRSSWKRFWRSIINRHAAQVQESSHQGSPPSSPRTTPGLVQCPETVTPVQEL